MIIVIARGRGDFKWLRIGAWIAASTGVHTNLTPRCAVIIRRPCVCDATAPCPTIHILINISVRIILQLHSFDHVDKTYAYTIGTLGLIISPKSMRG